ncbi:MAG: vitamin B12-dependent ribonucleotide reductase, partial [Bacteroidetes bacterium]|nr:vitamin B12-dependent ribonucleotide reductase [Bacteroidota bacterium]
LTLKNCPYINEESLKERGFTDEKIQLIEQQLPTVFNIRFAFNKYILGEDFLVSLGIDQAELNLPQFDLLSTLGYNEDEIEIANSYVTGTMTIEGAPHLSEEDLPIFDCANKCGKLGKRFISYMAHLRAMSAAQPFISGAISKTVNMPADATVQDIGDVYTNAYNMMIKAVALYRDNSKLSQPLNTTLNDFDEVVSLGDENTLDETKDPAEVYKIQKSKLERKRLPLRRSGITREVTIQNQKVYLRTGEYEDGSLGEIFIDMYKEGAAFRGLINSFAILTSKALQYGIPLHDLVNTFKFTRFEPAGIVQGHEEIRFTTSVLDYIFQSLEYDYITNKREVVKTEEVHHHHIETKQANTTSNDKNSKLANAKTLGYTGEQCPTCGSIRLKRNGSCMICEECGSTTGCS